jgi:hypothetical protein
MPTTTFNPFNPLSYWTLGSSGVKASRSTDRSPISIDVSKSDPGLKVSKGKNAITISGETKGFLRPRDVMGYPADYEVGRGMGFSLDVNKAKTTDALGRTDYTEKNSRLFSLTTSKGWSAEKCARMLADKVNGGDDFKATVKVSASGVATISFSRR